jgi:hypothetical protein
VNLRIWLLGNLDLENANHLWVKLNRAVIHAKSFDIRKHNVIGVELATCLALNILGDLYGLHRSKDLVLVSHLQSPCAISILLGSNWQLGL